MVGHGVLLLTKMRKEERRGGEDGHLLVNGVDREEF